MKELYIVQSAHISSVWYDPTYIQKAIEVGITLEEIHLMQTATELQDRVGKQIIKDIVREKGIECLFFDSMHKGIARLANRIAKNPEQMKELEKIIGNDGKAILQYLKLVQECYQETRGRITAYETEPEIVMKLFDERGLPGCLFPTVKWGFENELIGENDEEAQHVEREMIRYDQQKDNLKTYGDALLAAWYLIRDRAVFKNVYEHKGEKNILFMGSEHKLTDFDNLDLGFNIVRVCLYQESLNYILKTYEIKGSNKLEFKINLRNRETVPEGIREIVERNIEQESLSYV